MSLCALGASVVYPGDLAALKVVATGCQGVRSGEAGETVLTIRLRRNGPYVIEGEDVRVVDWNGAEYRSERQPVALCRCGASTRKPFCDGTHSRIGFQAAEEAVGPETKDRPAE